MALVAEAELHREPREVALAVGDPFERGAHAQTDAVPRDGVPGALTKDPAEVVGGDGELPGQFEQGPVGVVREQLPGALDDRLTSGGGRRAARSGRPGIVLLERAGHEQQRSFQQRVLVGYPSGRREQQPVLEVQSGGGGDRDTRPCALPSLQRFDQLVAQEQRRAIVAVVVRVVVPLLLGG